MNTIDNSHMEAVMNWIEDNPDHEFRMKILSKTELPWQMQLFNSSKEETTTYSAGKTFSDAIRVLSHWVGQQPRHK